jgi:DNA-binding CsgD family transcriptional regulator
MDINTFDTFAASTTSSVIEAMTEVTNNLIQIELYSDVRLKQKINRFKESKWTNIEDLFKDFEEIKKDYKKINEEPKHVVVNQNNVTNSLNYTIGQLKEEDICIVDMLGNGTVQSGNITYKIDSFDTVKKNVTSTTSMLLIYSIIKMNLTSNTSKFKLSEFMEFRGIVNPSEAAKKVKNDLIVLKQISNITLKDKKQDTQIGDSVIHKYKYYWGDITIIFNPDFADKLKKTYMFIPINLAQIKNKYAWVIGYYIYEQARINHTCSKKISIKSCLERTTLPSYEEVKEGDRHFERKIMTPFENAIDILSKEIDELDIEFEKDYKTIEEFMEGFIKINIKNKQIENLYNDLEIKRQRKNIEQNKLKKSERKKHALKLKEEGRSISEIAKILDLTPKTIKNYLK